MDSLDQARKLLKKELAVAGFDMKKKMTVRPLNPDEAVGKDSSAELALRRGPEKIVQAEMDSAIGQAFTDAPCEWSGTVEEALALPLEYPARRAFTVAAINCLMRKTGRCSGTIHCRDKDPEKCGAETVKMMEKRFGNPKIAMFGFQPFLFKALVERFGSDAIEVADLNPANIGTKKHGVTIRHGENDAAKMVEGCTVGFFTGSSITNGTFDKIRKLFVDKNKPLVLFGNTISGVATLLNYDRFCPFGQ